LTLRLHCHPWPSAAPGKRTKRRRAVSYTLAPSTQQLPGGDVFGNTCSHAPVSRLNVNWANPCGFPSWPPWWIHDRRSGSYAPLPSHPNFGMGRPSRGLCRTQVFSGCEAQSIDSQPPGRTPPRPRSDARTSNFCIALSSPVVMFYIQNGCSVVKVFGKGCPMEMLANHVGG